MGGFLPSDAGTCRDFATPASARAMPLDLAKEKLGSPQTELRCSIGTRFRMPERLHSRPPTGLAVGFGPRAALGALPAPFTPKLTVPPLRRFRGELGVLVRPISMVAQSAEGKKSDR